ncbi:acyl-CoA thioesterase [Mycolicibacterium phlei]|uniref:Acyl-CoA thioesterase n=1 Tax=Mycolicibacterium phlei DSM 43239 = CCUG 21000 TaxID=1226750 RepID=A0A5N5UPI6_MYCPH|nr:acyl-CoA thioesterase domain-containing protein [Mycolicibacterium phlei]VEG08730.1 acyl-CoA thioesterase [Mycobacteroides chelonae]AMO60612.1 Acyl-CoA thioesterase 2 [Mycolicibacterium phlei]EID13277.1 acyl-CoA thioesterase [Mycolicibacterium phlei RIVM601174]KAB7751506.1 acyl-CoA thioesterase [Mycolicibacterium phlei DSM 43239 = CCUG 21000]KXW68147.1 acyl-CoA thioesterase [Mycolicibacterium phlei DSM 43239 = CCUG 21000]
MTDDLTGPLQGTALEKAVLASLDTLEQALELQPLGEHRFRATNERDRFGRLFGGQLLGQALAAAARTVDHHPPHSLHAYFVQTGASDTPVDITVDAVRDGRSMATRQVTVAQGERTLLTAIASFHTGPAEPVFDTTMPDAPEPETMPLLQHWVPRAPEAMRTNAQTWIDVPPAIEIRIAEPTGFLGGPQRSGPRSHWMRLPRPVGADPVTHAALLAYASDYLMLDAAMRNHPQPADYGAIAAVSLDHALWLHRPVRFDEWHLYTQETVAISGHRALIRGIIHDAAGHTVASTAQEILVRPR